MSVSYDIDNQSVTFTIGDFPRGVQDNLLSTLDINGFISNESKFREIVAANISRIEGVSPEVVKKLLPIISVGNLLTLERDAEKNQFGLNFLLNKYLISLDVVPGRNEVKKEGAKVLAIIGISKQNDFYLTAYEDEEGNYRYAGRIEPFLAREKLFVEPLEESEDILWIDPKKFKKVKVTHAEASFSLQDAFTITDKVIKLGKKLSAIASNMKVVGPVEEAAPISQLMVDTVPKEAKMPHLKEIQQIVKDTTWQALREDLSWTKENISSSLRRLRQYMADNPSRKKKVRTLNLLNGVARGGIMNDQIKRMQLRLRKDLGVGEKETALISSTPLCVEKEGRLVYSAEYEWSYSPMKGGLYGRLTWLVPAILDQTRLKDDKWDPAPLSSGDLEILKILVKKGRKSPKELLREQNYYREWHSGKWTEEDKQNIENEVLERVTGAHQTKYQGKLPPFLKEPFKIGDRVKALQGAHRGGIGNVIKVDAEHKSITVLFIVFDQPLEAILPYTHAELLPPEIVPKTEKPEESKRQYIPVKEELEKILSNFQPGNWLAFMHGVSPKGTKSEQLMHFYKERATFKREFPTVQEIMERLAVDNTAVSHLVRAIMERAQKCSTPEGAREFLTPKKKSAFMPSIGRPPFWDQRPDGGGAGDYKYPLETLYPVEFWDTWNAYTKMNAKVDPAILMNLLHKLKLSKDDKKEKPLEKVAILEMDPDIAVRFYIPRISITLPDSSGIGGKYEAVLIGQKPSATERLKGVDPDKKKVPFLGKTPAERIQEGKIPSLPIPQEGDRAPIYFLPGIGKRLPDDKPFKPLADTGEVIYQVKRLGEDAETQDTVIGYFDAMDFLTHTVKKGHEQKGLREWLITRLTTRAVEIKKFLILTSPNKDIKERLSWKTRLLQAAISEDWDEAFRVVKESGLPPEKRASHENAIAGYSISKMLREKDYTEMADAIKKYKVLPHAWAGLSAEQTKERLESLPTLGGKIAKSNSLEYAEQANLVLQGNDMFPGGGSIEAKRKVIRDISIPRLLEFILSDGFLSQPYAVQSTAVRRLEAAGTSGEEGLFAVWKKKDIPASLRKEALNALVLAYGVGTKGQGYSSEGRFKATKNLLTEAAEDADADVRAAAYMLMKDPSVDFLPWTNQGKLTYSPSKALNKKDQPSKDIPDWMIVQLRNEPYSELRNILLDLIEELPKDLVKEEQPPKLSPELKILIHGKYSFKEEILPGITQLLLTALTDNDPRVRARVRSYFGLPRELDLVKTEKEAPKLIEPSAKDYIFHAKVALTQKNLEDAEKQLAAAAKANDAAEYKEEIESLKKNIVEAREELNNKEELEKKIPELQKTILKQHPSLSSDNGKAFFDWVAQLKYQTTFEGLSLKNKTDILTFLAKDSAWYEHWAKDPQQSADKVIQPELPLEPEDGEERAFEKRGSPLSSLELTSRQPPTTWPLSNPGPGYSSAFPLGAKDDDLLLKDVRQFYGRPEGKWRSILNQIYDMLFKNKEEEKKKEEEKPQLKKTAAELPPDEAGLLQLVKSQDSESLRQVLRQAEDKGYLNVVQAVVDLPAPPRPSDSDIHVEAIRTLYRMKAIPNLGKLLFTPWHPLAVKYLAQLGQAGALKSTFKAYSDRPSLQRHIVLTLGEEGDDAFLEDALQSPNVDVRKQVAEWLTYHKKFDILKKHLGSEKDAGTKAAIEKFLAMADQGPAADALPEMSPEEQEKKISQLIKLATDAFTRWEKYPQIRREILGTGGKRFGISTFNDWATAQKEIDTEITEKMSELPTVVQGQAALRDLEKIVEKLPDATKRINRLKEWVTEAEEKYRANSSRQPSMSDDQWEQIQTGLDTLQQKIKDAKENLRKFEVGLKADLTFRVDQLKLLERSAIARDRFMGVIARDGQFREDYGLSSKTWKEYQAYLMTFDKNFTLEGSEGKIEREGINTLEQSQRKLEEQYAKPIAKKLREEEKEFSRAADRLLPFYKKLGLSVGRDKEPIAPGTSDLRDKIHQYQQLEEQWFKLSGAVEPYAEVDNVKYRMTPALWILPSQSTSLPEYGRGKRLVHERVAELRSPWSLLIEENQRKIVKLNKDLVRKLSSKLPAQGQEFLQTKENHRLQMEKLQSVLNAIGSSSDQTQKDKELVASRKEYEVASKNLINRLREAETLKEKNPEAYIKLQVDLKEFMNRYTVPPIPAGPEANLKKQYFYDRWRSPGLRGPRGTPQVVTPGEEAAPYSGTHDFTDEERAEIEKEIARRIKEYGPPKLEDR